MAESRHTPAEDIDVDELELNGGLDEMSRSQLTRAVQGLRAAFSQRVHADTLVALAKSKWLKVDRMELDSDRTTAYLKITIKIKLGQK